MGAQHSTRSARSDRDGGSALVDPSTLELTQMLVEQVATAPLMLLATARPEFRPPWPLRAHHVQITLNRLKERHTREMVASVVARTALAQDLIEAVVKRTDGFRCSLRS